MTEEHTQNLHAYQRLRTAVQILSLLIFVGLMILGLEQFWLMIFAVAGLAVSLIWGRVFCGWICPMGTMLRLQTWIYRKLKIRRYLPKAASQGHWIRWAAVIGFLILLITTRRQGLQIPVLPYLTLAALAVSLVLHEAFWHRVLCPFGALLSVTAGASRSGIGIDRAACTTCGKCERVCASRSIAQDDQRLRYNRTRE